MAHAAIAFAKASRRRRMMACTTSIGPGATNMVTAAAVAHVNRLPVLLLPGDVFANRRPDPVLQQIESFSDGTVSANDCFRPVSRYFDRITRPEQIIPALQRAMTVLTDPAECGPVTLALCQDAQAEAYDYPESFFAETDLDAAPHPPRRAGARRGRGAASADAKKPFIVAGGGVLYSGAENALADFARDARPSRRRDAGRQVEPAARPSSQSRRHRRHRHGGRQRARRGGRRGARGRHAPAGLHHRLLGPVQEPGPAHRRPQRRRPSTRPSTTRCRWSPTRASAWRNSSRALGAWKAPDAWTAKAREEKTRWFDNAARYTDPTNAELPSDAQVIGAVQRSVAADRRGGLRRRRPAGRAAQALEGERRPRLPHGIRLFLHGLRDRRRARRQDGRSRRARSIVMVGDGSYLMMNSEIATSVMLGLKLTVVLLDNRGYGCINRLQRATGGESFNNLLQHTQPRDPARDRLRGPCGKPRRAGDQGEGHRRTGGRPEEGAQRRAHAP